MKKCPFRKWHIVTNYHLHGHGAPMAERTREDFDECIGKECMAFRIKTEIIPATSGKTHEITYCSLCGKDS